MKSYKIRARWLTALAAGDSIRLKIESLNRGAVFISIRFPRPDSRNGERERRRSEQVSVCLLFAGPSENIRRTVTSICGALSWPMETPLGPEPFIPWTA